MPRGTKYNYEDHHKEINGILYKKCVHHLEYFPDENEWLLCNNEYFYKNTKNKKDGLNPSCKKCEIVRASIVQANNPEKAKKAKRKHYENNLDKWYDRRIAYYKTHNNKEIQKRWYNNNKEKALTTAEYRKFHKKHDITDEQWEICKTYFNNCCAYCGLPIEKHIVTRNNKIIYMDFHKEHVDDEGSNGLENCVPSCTSCNTSKRQYKLGVWYNPNNKRRGGKVFTQERLDKINQWVTEDHKPYLIEIKKLPYRIIRRRVDHNNGTYRIQHELWTINKDGNMIECLATANKKKGLNKYIEKYFGNTA